MNPDSFRVFRKYSSLPSHNPDDIDPFTDIPSVQSGSVPASQPPVTELIGSNLTVSSTGSDSDLLANSKNPTVDLLLSWYSEGSTDGATGLDCLVNCIHDPHFDVSQLEGFTAVGALREFEKTHLSSEPGSTLEPGDGWRCGKVAIRVLCTGHKQCEEDAPEFTVDGIWYRDPVEVITKELADPDSFENIHIKPFKEYWRPTKASNPIRVYSEVYTSDAMLQLEKELEETSEATAGPQLETFNLSALLYSDSTNLTQFDHASLWPMYMFVGNTSKYLRSRPNSFSAHHITYLPTVNGSFTSSCQTRSRSFITSTTAYTLTPTCLPTSSGNSSTARCGWSWVARSQMQRRTVGSPGVQMMSGGVGSSGCSYILLITLKSECAASLASFFMLTQMQGADGGHEEHGSIPLPKVSCPQG